MRPIVYRLNVEVSGIEELKEACKEVSKKAEELQEAIDRLSIIEIELKAKADYFISENATYREAKIACEKLFRQVSHEIELRAMESKTF